jgi:osmoprotectant transport system substrate-binding protein
VAVAAPTPSTRVSAKDWQNAEHLVPVVSTEFLEANPEVEEVLNGLSGVLTTEDLMRLNAAVDAEGQLVGDVATNYLQESNCSGPRRA